MKTFVITAIVNATTSFRSSTLSQKVYKLSQDCYVVFQDGNNKGYEGPDSSDYAKIRLDNLTTKGSKMVLCLAGSNPGATTMYQTSRATATEKVFKTFLEPNFVSDGYTLQTQWENAQWADYTVITEMATFLYQEFQNHQKLGFASAQTQAPSKECYAISEVDGLHFEGPMRADKAFEALGTYTKHGGVGVTRMVLCRAQDNPDKLTLEQELFDSINEFDSANKKAREFWMSPHQVTNGEQVQGKWGDFRSWWKNYFTIERVAVKLYDALNAAWHFDQQLKWQWDSSACPQELPEQKCYKADQCVEKSLCAHLPKSEDQIECPKQTIISS